jgi:HD-like signal output (HDOD) protein
MSEALEKAILQCQSVISLPEVYQQISIKIDQAHTTHHELAEIVKLDPGVSSKLLAIVNSAFYGFSGQISSIAHAISIVGLNDFKNLVLSSSLVQQFEELKGSDFSLHDFWDHSLLCAILCKRFGSLWLSRRQQEELFIAGLLHNVGKLMMLQTQAQQIPQLLPAWSEVDLMAEKTLVGFDHAEAGAALITAWELPERLALCAAQHHQLSAEAPHPAVVAVYLANAVAQGEYETALLQSNAWVEQPLTPEEVEQIRGEAVAEKNSLIGVFLSM